MRTLKILYWVTTLLFAAQMLYDAVLNLIPHDDAVTTFNKIGIPSGMLALYGVAKLVAGLIILLPVMKSLKEWSYAILLFMVIETAYAMASAGFPVADWALMLIPFLLGILSYIFWKFSNIPVKREENGITISVTPTTSVASYENPLQD